jgi:TPR repeat protein
MGMNRTFKAAVAALMLAVGSAGSVAAGPFEDAADALDKRDYATALRLMRALAEQGLAQAQFSLGQIYYRDIQFAAAAGWYRKAAEQGNAEAQFNLGFMYALGQGVPQRDDAASAGWYSKAAEQGYAKAQVSLGLMYEAGLGVRKDNAAAAGWYRKAAEQGNAEAQVFLGVMYREGRGVPQDYASAHMWFNLAAASGDEAAAQARDMVAAQMTPAQIAEAQKLAREWKPTTVRPAARVGP